MIREDLLILWAHDTLILQVVKKKGNQSKNDLKKFTEINAH